jgi:predicted transcriptional regulator
VKVSDYMTEQVETVNKNDSLRDVFNVMKREQVRRVPVTDREGRLVGIIAQADLAVDYAGLDLQRETEVEEVIERISEPGRSGRR